MPVSVTSSRAGVAERWPHTSYLPGWSAWIPSTPLLTIPGARRSLAPSLRRSNRKFPTSSSQAMLLPSLLLSHRSYATSSSSSNAHHHAGQADVDDWSSIEVEVLEPERGTEAAQSASKAASASAATSSGHSTTSAGGAPAESTMPGVSFLTHTEAVVVVDAIDTYAKAKVMNFIRRQQQQQQHQQPHGGSSSAAATSTSSFSSPMGSGNTSTLNASIPGMEVREVQGGVAGDSGGPTTTTTVQFHARWRLPLPAEYGERFGEGFAPTAKEAEGVAAMHAERVIDALGFPLFLLSSKQRKHAEAARAGGRWAPMPPSPVPTTPSSSSASPGVEGTAAAELVPPPETPSPPPLRLHHVSAREKQERQLHIDKVAFTPVEKGVFAPLTCTLASPFYFDSSSVRRVEGFFKVHRASYAQCLRLFLLRGDSGGGASKAQHQHRNKHRANEGDLFLAQLTLPLPARFGIRVAMGRGPTRRDAVTLACMHAELIIDAVGFALYPSNHTLQATHAEECARVRRWCAPPGDCDYRYTVPSPAPLELVEKVDPAVMAAAAATGAPTRAVETASVANGSQDIGGGGGGDADGSRRGPNTMHSPHHADVDARQRDGTRLNVRQGSGERHDGTSPIASADIQVGATSSASVESILLQHHHAVKAMTHFVNEVSMRDYENAQLLLERYLEQFVATPTATTAATSATAVGAADAATATFPACPSSSPSGATPSPLRSLMFVEMLGQRDRPTYRATITIPLVDAVASAEGASSASPPFLPPSSPSSTQPSNTAAAAVSTGTVLPYTHSFVAMGVADTPHVAELAASLHALRTLAALNRLTLHHGSPAIQQALESFAQRGHLPLFNPKAPMLYPAGTTASPPLLVLPPAVRVMEGVVGRVNASGLKGQVSQARAQVFTPGVRVITFNASRKEVVAAKLTHTVEHRYGREDFLMQELRQARLRVPRLDWDVTPDAHHRIIVAPDANPRTARQYSHTLSSVRNPDTMATLRVRDYLERHGKTADMAHTTVRVRVSDDSPEEGYMYVTTLPLPLPEGVRWRAADEEAASLSDTTAAEVTPTPTEAVCKVVKGAPTLDAAAASVNAHAEGKSGTAGPAALRVGTTAATFIAQGEAPTREESMLLCDAHAELLLDALGIALYDNPGLQRKHADVARSLGRWAPLSRNAMLAPPSLRPLPPPLRKVTEASALWAQVQRERHAAALQARTSDSAKGSAEAGGPSSATDAASASPTSAPGGVDGGAGGAQDVNDEALFDLSTMRYVHAKDIFYDATKIMIMFYAQRGLDFHRGLRQYRVDDPKYGKMYRAIAELPVPPMYGKRYAIGLANEKRYAYHLCAMHAVHVLEALNVRVFANPRVRMHYVQKGALREAAPKHLSRGVAVSDKHKPSPPGYHALRFSDAAVAGPPSRPRCPPSAEARELRVWKAYVKRCESYQLQWTEHRTRQAVTAVPLPHAPRGGLPPEDAALAIAEAAPLEADALRQLRHCCHRAGLAYASNTPLPFTAVQLSTEKRVWLAEGPLWGTPYTMRGLSAESGPESRLRAYMHGVELVRRVTRANNRGWGRVREGWAEGLDRGTSVLDPQSGELTHHGRLWVLRLWGALHFPPRVLQLVVREAEAEAEEGKAEARGQLPGSPAAKRSDDPTTSLQETRVHHTTTPQVPNDPHTIPAAASVTAAADCTDATETETASEPSYYASVAIVEVGGGSSRSHRHSNATSTTTTTTTSVYTGFDGAKVVVQEAHVASGLHGTAAVRGAVHRVFAHLQHSLTMQALHRFLTSQPQMHLPSLRALRDDDAVVQRMSLQLRQLNSSSSQATASRPSSETTTADKLKAPVFTDGALPQRCNLPAQLLIFSARETDELLPTYSTWPVEVLRRWVRAHHNAEGTVDAAELKLPHTLAPLFVNYGLVSEASSSSASAGRVAGSARAAYDGADGVVGVPSMMAGALATLCLCLPPLPCSASSSSRASPASTTASSTQPVPTDGATTRDHTLPLQLAHLLLMGALLDCLPWVVRVVAMVVCAEDTLNWYTHARRATQLASSGATATPSASSTLHLARGEDVLRSCVSADVAEVVLFSAGAGAAAGTTETTLPALPASVDAYERQLRRRLLRVSADVLKEVRAVTESATFADKGEEEPVPTTTHRSASTAATSTAAPSQPSLRNARHLLTAEVFWKSVKESIVESTLTVPSLQETRRLRALLQCAVVASAAPHEVWVRAGRAENAVRDACVHGAAADDSAVAVDEAAAHAIRGGSSDDGSSSNLAPSSEEIFVFQGRRTAAFAALCVDGADLTRTDTDSKHSLSSMATCFASFGCAVDPVRQREADELLDDSKTVAAPVAPSAAVSDSSMFIDTGEEKDDYDVDGGSSDASEADSVDGDDDSDDKGTPELISTALFTRVLGTCVTPLAAAVVGQQSLSPTGSLSKAARQDLRKEAIDESALRLAGEELPMLMATFHETVPLIVHDANSRVALMEVAAHLRRCVQEARPFTEVERKLIVQLFTLPVEEVRDDGIDDA